MSQDALLSLACEMARRSDRVDKVQRAAHESAAVSGPEVFAAFAFARLLRWANSRVQNQAPSKAGAAAPAAEFFATPRPPAEMLSGYALARQKGPAARKLLERQSPSRLSRDTMFMLFLRKTPVEMLPALLDLGLMKMAQAEDHASCQSLLFLGADPNRPHPVEGLLGRSAIVAAYAPDKTHPLASLAKLAAETYYEPMCVSLARLYVAMGARPGGELSPYPPGAQLNRGVRASKGKPMAPMAQCFASGAPELARALLEAGAPNPHQPDLNGLVPADLLNDKVSNRSRQRLLAFLSETLRDELFADTRPPAGQAIPTSQRPRL